MDKGTEFWTLAYQAINEGLLTKEEALTVCRAGSRKQNYWIRHVMDLQNIVEERRGGGTV
jgi:hypothetical protein